MSAHIIMKTGRFLFRQIQLVRELLFLTFANHLPRIPFCDTIRAPILRVAGMKVGKNCIVWGPVTVRPIGALRNVYLGDNVFLNTETRFGCPHDKIFIQDNAQIGPRVSFETVNHGLYYVPGRGRGAWTKPIIVGECAWIGANATILQGVTIGNGAVVSAGAVVSKNVEPNTVVGGVPAKLISRIEKANPAG